MVERRHGSTSLWKSGPSATKCQSSFFVEDRCFVHNHQANMNTFMPLMIFVLLLKFSKEFCLHLLSEIEKKEIILTTTTTIEKKIDKTTHKKEKQKKEKNNERNRPKEKKEKTLKKQTNK